MDCESFSPNALKIFEKIREYYPPDPWKNQQWTEEGRVYYNGWYDLRKKDDRDKLLHSYEYLIGSTIVMFANANKSAGKKLTPSVFRFQMSRKWIESAVLLLELDFQIETLDLVES